METLLHFRLAEFQVPLDTESRSYNRPKFSVELSTGSLGLYITSGVITTLISLFKILQQQCHLVTFFNFPKMKPKVKIIDLRLLERSLYAAIFLIVKIARHYIIF